MKGVGRTHLGMRREQNQDSILVLPEIGFFAVADGMGGHRGGQVASRLVADELSRAALREKGEFDAEALARLLVQVNRVVHEAGQSNEDLHAMGSTCVVAHAEPDRLHVAYVGDSRAYLVSGSQARQLTRDHRAIQSMIDDGVLSVEESRSHPLRGVLTRSIGVEADVEADSFSVAWSKGDRLLLCSDGLSDLVQEANLLERVRSADDLGDLADELVAMANEAGGDDNISVVLVENG